MTANKLDEPWVSALGVRGLMDHPVQDGVVSTFAERRSTG